jgi:TATA-box binding protein (TBP) (component of TFIID and TFIIIB)
MAADGCIEINRVHCGGGLEAEIANVTTRHYLAYSGKENIRVDVDEGVTYDAADVALDLPLVAEFTHCMLGMSGPTSKGMPSASAVFQRRPLYGKTKVSIYGGGKVVQTGYLSPEQARACAHDVARVLNRRLGTRLRVRDFTVINIVAIVRTGRVVDCTALKRLVGSRCTYDDPKTVKRLHGKKGYSGAIVSSRLARPRRNPKMVVFTTGIAVLMGCQRRAEIVELVQEFLSYIDTLDAQASERRLVGGAAAPRQDPFAAMSTRDLIDAAKDILAMYQE